MSRFFNKMRLNLFSPEINPWLLVFYWYYLPGGDIP